MSRMGKAGIFDQQGEPQYDHVVYIYIYVPMCVYIYIYVCMITMYDTCSFLQGLPQVFFLVNPVVCRRPSLPVASTLC